MNLSKSALVLALLGAALSQPAFAAETCEQMRERIERQAKSKGLKTAEVIAVTVKEGERESKGKVVGTCAMGQKRVVLRR